MLTTLQLHALESGTHWSAVDSGTSRQENPVGQSIKVGSTKLTVVGVIRPGALRATEVSASGKIGVIGTRATVQSEAYPPAIRALIRDDKVHQIQSSMQAGKKHGMQTLTDSLYQLYMSRQVSMDECLRVAPDQNEFLRAVGEPGPGEKQAAGSRR